MHICIYVFRYVCVHVRVYVRVCVSVGVVRGKFVGISSFLLSGPWGLKLRSQSFTARSLAPSAILSTSYEVLKVSLQSNVFCYDIFIPILLPLYFVPVLLPSPTALPLSFGSIFLRQDFTDWPRTH